MLLVDDLAAGGTKNLRHTPRGLVTLVTHSPYEERTRNGQRILLSVTRPLALSGKV